MAASDIKLAVAFLSARGGSGRLGIAGTIGKDGAIGRAEIDALGVVCWSGAAEEGVVG